MNIESVKSVFTLFSGETDFEKYSPIIDLAVSEVENMISSEGCSDVRLDFLCAALANYRLQQINAAHDRYEDTYAGKMLNSPADSGTLGYAERLLADYMDLCRDIIKPQTFTFMSFGCGTEELC